MDIRQSLKNASNSLGRIPSLGYGIAYLLCIPLFALFFTISSDDFYHSTVQHEDAIDADALRILTAIQTQMRDGFITVNGSEIAYEDDWGVNINEIEVHSLENRQGTVIFRLSTKFFGRNELEGTRSTGGSVSVVIESGPRLGIVNPDDNDFTFYKEISLEYPKALPVSLKLLFPKNIPNNALSKDIQQSTTYLAIPLSLENMIINFQNSLSGFPSESSGVYGRMLYLSAVTITTLGYGDIVPISGISRLLVALESVIGIVLIGLFLNSLNQEGKLKQ